MGCLDRRELACNHLRRNSTISLDAGYAAYILSQKSFNPRINALWHSSFLWRVQQSRAYISPFTERTDLKWVALVPFLFKSAFKNAS